MRPPLEADDLQLVVAAVALATRTALERLSGLRAQLKWPNDLVVGDHKLAGLLAEVVDTGGGFAVVVGLGVNLTFEGPDHVDATSVRRETGLTIVPRALLDILLEEFEDRRERLESDEGRAALRREYERALSTVGSLVRVELHDATFYGRALGVDDAGRLLVDVDGDIKIVGVGDVVHVRLHEGERDVSRATRVLVTGAGGQVGVDLLDVLAGETPWGGDATFRPDVDAVGEGEFDVLGLTHHDLDVTDRDAVLKSLTLTRPDVIVHLAAYTAVDRAEGDAEACFAVNAAGTANMSWAAREVGAHSMAISTDYVFDGQKGAAYDEHDEPILSTFTVRPSSLANSRARRRLVVRTSWVMGVRGKNVVHTIAERATSGADVRFVNDQMGTVTASSDLARALASSSCANAPAVGGTWPTAGRRRGTTSRATSGTLLGRESGFATPITSRTWDPARRQRPIRSDLDPRSSRRGGRRCPTGTTPLERLAEQSRPRLRGNGVSDVARTSRRSSLTSTPATCSTNASLASRTASLDLVVVENGEVGLGAAVTLREHVCARLPRSTSVMVAGSTAASLLTRPITYVLVSNPDVIVHPGAVSALVNYLDEHPDVALVGPSILRPDGTVYPSQRVFPNLWLAGAHALLSPLWPENPATSGTARLGVTAPVDWVSGAFFLVRRCDRFEEVGGFDERYFMFAEEMALCWQTP